MQQVTRAARGAVAAMILAVVVAAPVAAAQPTRTVYDLESFPLPAGTACAFDVEGLAEWGFYAETDFSDGSVMYSFRAHGAYVNVSTHASFPTADTFRELRRVDPATGLRVVTINGQNTYNFLPGDQGPFGLVGPGPALYHIVGDVSYTQDPVTGQFLQFAWAGAITDVCAVLA